MDQNNTNLTEVSNLFDEYLNLETAGKGQRFANYIIDVIVYYIFAIVCSYFFFAAYFAANPDAAYTFKEDKESLGFKLTSYMVAFFLFVLFYTILEGALKGKTIGKFITKTRAVQADGQPITWKNALLRSLVRIVPLEAFSGLGDNIWHDGWTNTIVIKDRKGAI